MFMKKIKIKEQTKFQIFGNSLNFKLNKEIALNQLFFTLIIHNPSKLNQKDGKHKLIIKVELLI